MKININNRVIKDNIIINNYGLIIIKNKKNKNNNSLSNKKNKIYRLFKFKIILIKYKVSTII